MYVKHKWHKEIKAWADGAEIEKRRDYCDWLKATHPNWNEDNGIEYRIKPQPKEPKYLYAYSTSQGIKFCGKGGTIEVTSPNEFIMLIGKIKLEVDDEN